MRKIIVILILVAIATGCSITRNVSNINLERSNRLVSNNVVESVIEQNITNTGFFIQKAEIEFINEKGKEIFISSIKYEKPDKYLISLKSRSGIEGARIYISNDTILVNDRISKVLYYGTAYYLRTKYGFSQAVLPLVFGDIIIEKNCENNQIKCSEEKVNIRCGVKGLFLNYSIDCKKRKTILVDQMSNYVKQSINIKYEKFFNVGPILIPKMIEINDYEYNTTLRIKILKIESPWTGNIRFIPGKGYELIKLV
ncbi:MAG: DUF4292 domain-containing protein [Bacteroidales bacterium]